MHNQPLNKVKLPGLLVEQGSNNKSGEIFTRMINEHVYFYHIYLYSCVHVEILRIIRCNV